MAKEQRKPTKRMAPGVQFISDGEFDKTMNKLRRIQEAADAATNALNNLKATLVTISF